MIQIIPTIMTDDVGEAREKLRMVGGLVERAQIDIIDGKFAKNRTISVDALNQINTGLIMDVQLMVDDPIGYLSRCDGVGVERVYGHVEQMRSQSDFVDQAVSIGLQVGLGLDIHTPIVAIQDMLPYLDAVLLMAVEVGFSGEEFNNRVLKKIEELRSSDFEGDICIDGGLDTEEIALCVEQGANHFAVNSALWEPFGKLRPSAKDIAKKLEELQRIQLN